MQKKKGVTKILCVAVNDPNVMKAWGENQNVGDKIFMAADPYCCLLYTSPSPRDRG